MHSFGFSYSTGDQDKSANTSAIEDRFCLEEVFEARRHVLDAAQAVPGQNGSKPEISHWYRYSQILSIDTGILIFGQNFWYRY